jgi:small subunit ribosomal protein S20
MAKEEKKPTKRPTALKRDLRNNTLRLINKSFKSKARTVVKSFEDVIKTKDKDRIQAALSDVYSIVDRGVKSGVYKRNKAARIKARLSHKASVGAN